MSERKAFKEYFDAALVRQIAAWVADAEPRFARTRFLQLASYGLGGLEMMARVGQIADALCAALPGPTAVNMRVLAASLPPKAPSGEGIMDHGYALWPFGEFIARYGLDDVDASFACMLELTQRFTSEFAVRPFLARDADGMLDRLASLCAHESEHVRRWVSEGTRTRLPWGQRVPALEARLDRRLALLAELRHDPSRYVQRSVANHLGDVLKDDRARGLETLEAWMVARHPSSEWIVRHAARHLLKQGDTRVLALFGQAPSDTLRIEHFEVSSGHVAIGGVVVLRVRVCNDGHVPCSLRLDYRLESPGAGARRNVTTFRMPDAMLAPGEARIFEKAHLFAPRRVRKLRPGRHFFVFLANGKEAGRVEVTVCGTES